jgi:Flp pilus assembly protein TadG
MKRLWLRAATSARRGTAAVDFAMVSVVFLPLCFGIIELGIVLWVQNSLQAAAELTARCVATQNTACSDAKSYAVTTASAWLPSGMVKVADVTVWTGASCNGSPGTAVIVTITRSYWGGTNLPPLFQSLTTSASSCFATGA